MPEYHSGVDAAPIKSFREMYARLACGLAGCGGGRVEAAFASVERERYLGPGPWRIHVGGSYVETPSNDPRFVYQDVVIALAEIRGIHNGQPSLHAQCLAACEPQPGESVVHVGAGTGYYTAILAELVGAEGKVTAFEIDADLADRACKNLSAPNVHICRESAATAAISAADVIYVCAGATHPLASWLDALRVGGRLVFPLTPDEGLGTMLLVTRSQSSSYSALALADVAIIPCFGAREARASESPVHAFATKRATDIRSLRRASQPDETAWCGGEGWWLSTADLEHCAQ